jgi:hypothetical protein
MGISGKAVGLAALWLGMTAAPQAQAQQGVEFRTQSGWTYQPEARVSPSIPRVLPQRLPPVPGCDSSIVDHAREHYLAVVSARSNNFQKIQPAALGLETLPVDIEARARVVREFVNTQMQTLMGCSNEKLNRTAFEALQDSRSGGFRKDVNRFAYMIRQDRPDWVETYFSNDALTRLTDSILHARELNTTPEQRDAIVRSVLSQREEIVPRLVRKFLNEAFTGRETPSGVDDIIYGMASVYMQGADQPAPVSAPRSNAPANNNAAAVRVPSQQECLQYYPQAVSAFVQLYKKIDPDFSKLRKEEFGVESLPPTPAGKEVFIRDQARKSFGPLLNPDDPVTCSLVKRAREGDAQAYEEMKKRFTSTSKGLGISMEDSRIDLEQSLADRLGRPLNDNEQAQLSAFMAKNAPAMADITAGFIVDVTILQKNESEALLAMYERMVTLFENSPAIYLDAPALKI